MARSYYSAALAEFLVHDDDYILGQLARHHQHDLDANQKRAWLEQVIILKKQLKSMADTDGCLFFEFSIPRMGKRADVIFLVQGTVFVLEFKVGSNQYHVADQIQAIDYALDLKNFHEGSHELVVVPVLVATEARDEALCLEIGEASVTNCLKANQNNLETVLRRVMSEVGALSVDPVVWQNSRYKPTPTIIQAAQALYCGHDVNDISRSDAGAENLTVTASCISEIIDRAKKHNEKAICFVTGVPGAGKTLAGLNIANSRMNAHEDEHAVFLSGNGPLVDVLREALARDEQARTKVAKGEAKRRASTFIQNIHHFRDYNLETDQAPIEKVVVFDEAQRAWHQSKLTGFMKTKKGIPNFQDSEPEFLISVMDRHEDWAVIVCLVGGGQEINDGEAGLSEWFVALQKRFKHWKVYHSSQMLGDEYAWGDGSPEDQVKSLAAEGRHELHLAVSVRSFRAEKLSAFVHAVVHNQPDLAREIYDELKGRYPIYLSRDLNKAREWLHQKARGSELYGLVASSGAIRLKPEGVNIKAKAQAVEWFLNGKYDVRACQYLEDVATEFDVQGLELDWTGVCWDGDFRYCEGQWSHYKFKGTKWQNVNKSEAKRYLENAYRVLLTRARQGMVIFVPHGSDRDATRPPAFYDETFRFLQRCGVEELA